MNQTDGISREGYLNENYHYFHLKDTSGQERDFHFHEFDKLVLLKSGRVDYTVESRTFSLKPNDVLLVKHHTIHRADIDTTTPYERVIIYINGAYFQRCLPGAGLMDCFDRAEKSGRLLLTPNEAQSAAISALLGAYEENASSAERGANAMCDTLMMQLLINVDRVSAASAPEREARSDGKIADTLSYINENLRSDLTVDALAERLYLSKYHFMRLFKAQTGSTVHAYVRQKRLFSAVRMMREGVPAERAAIDSGFGDYSAFYRAFRETFGITPGKLRTSEE